jgi:hypothetical protein
VRNALVRTVLAAFALVALAWFAVGYRETRLEARGDAALAALRAHDLSPEQGRDGLQGFRDAQWLNPDESPLIKEGELSFFLGRRDKAAAIAKDVTAAEPENIGGWFLAYLVARGAARTEAGQRVKGLDPWVGDKLP